MTHIASELTRFWGASCYGRLNVSEKSLCLLEAPMRESSSTSTRTGHVAMIGRCQLSHYAVSQRSLQHHLVGTSCKRRLWRVLLSERGIVKRLELVAHRLASLLDCQELFFIRGPLDVGLVAAGVQR